jgi:hypothetical protein
LPLARLATDFQVGTRGPRVADEHEQGAGSTPVFNTNGRGVLKTNVGGELHDKRKGQTWMGGACSSHNNEKGEHIQVGHTIRSGIRGVRRWHVRPVAWHGAWHWTAPSLPLEELAPHQAHTWPWPALVASASLLQRPHCPCQHCRHLTLHIQQQKQQQQQQQQQQQEPSASAVRLTVRNAIGSVLPCAQSDTRTKHKAHCTSTLHQHTAPAHRTVPHHTTQHIASGPLQ